MPRVVVIDGKRQQFPDDATDQEISAALGAIPAANAEHAPKARTWTDTAVDALPAALGTAGAVIGGVGGTAFGMGIGGVPGAAGGAALGTGAGEAAKQLINRLRGAEAPATAGEAFEDIAVPAVTAGVTTGVLGGAGKIGIPLVGKGLQKLGKTMASPMSVRRLAGKGIEALGNAIESAPSAPKIKIDATDFQRIRALVEQGISEKDAVRTILNLKVQGR